MDQEKQEELLDLFLTLSMSLGKLNKWVYERNVKGWETNQHTRNYHGQVRPVLENLRDGIRLLTELYLDQMDEPMRSICLEDLENAEKETN
jgi:hypothetical protein